MSKSLLGGRRPPLRARAPSAASVICCRCLAQLAILFLRAQFFFRAASGVRSNGLCPQSVFAAGGLVPVGFKHSWPSEPEPEKPEPEVTTFLLPRAAEPREEDFMRNKAAPVFHSSNHVLVPCEFRHTGPDVSEAELLECLYRVGDDKYQGKGCAWMAWRLVGQAQPPDVGHHVVLRPERGANLWVFFHKPTMKLLPSTHLYKLGKGKLHDVVKLMANCLEQNKTMRAMSRGKYDDMTTSEFQSHLIKLDTTFKALNTGKRPPNTEDEFVHLQSRALVQLRKQLQDDQLQTESLLVSPTSDDRLRHQREHRELLVVQPRGPPEAATRPTGELATSEGP